MRKQVKIYPSSKVVDLRHVDVSAHLEGLEVDPAEFNTWLAVEIGKYKVTQELLRALRPKLSEEKRELKDLTNLLRLTRMRAKPSSVPPGVRDALKVVSKERDVGWRDACTAVDEASRNLLEMLEPAEVILKTKPSKKGQPSMYLRNELLGSIVQKLKNCGATAAESRERAEAILIASHIPTPSGERNIRRATKGHSGIS